MKKIIALILAVLLIACLAVPAYAVTPKYEFPELPEIPDISDDVKIEIDIPDSFWADWFEKCPIRLGGEESNMTKLLKKWAGKCPVPAFNIPSEWLKERLKGAFG